MFEVVSLQTGGLLSAWTPSVTVTVTVTGTSWVSPASHPPSRPTVFAVYVLFLESLVLTLCPVAIAPRGSAPVLLAHGLRATLAGGRLSEFFILTCQSADRTVKHFPQERLVGLPLRCLMWSLSPVALSGTTPALSLFLTACFHRLLALGVGRSRRGHLVPCRWLPTPPMPEVLFLDPGN